MTGDRRRPGASRMMDYLLGDGHSLSIDRTLADELERAFPDIRTIVQWGRMFLRTAVDHLVGAGVRQFVKFGVDISTAGAAHAVAEAADPDCRVVYVDTDPIAVAHGRLSLAGNERAAVIQAELRDLDAVLGHPDTLRLLDPTRPVGLLVLDVLRFLPEAWDPPALLARYAARLAPGSHLVIAHLTSPDPTEETAALAGVMGASTDPIQARTRDEIVELFAGFELVGPGVAGVGAWVSDRALSPAEQAAATRFYVGIGRKPLPGKRIP
jgi:SAM-dependent methyltransferase